MRLLLIFSLVFTFGLGASLILLGESSNDQLQSSESFGGDNDLVAAAKAFLNALDDKERTKATFPFPSDERYNWNFVPLKRKGVTFRELSAPKRELAMQLLRTCRSEKGLEKAREIMALESVLTILEGREPGNDYRNPELYYISIFGQPSEKDPWGWRFEGHHISLNYSSVGSQLSVNPAFLGANPAKVPSGPQKGKRVLGEEEDKGRSLILALNDNQRQQAIISDKAYMEIKTAFMRLSNLKAPEGIAFKELEESQQKLFLEVIKVYLNDMTEAAAKEWWEKIQSDGLENHYFAWAGGLEVGQKHYYRIHGPRLLIEFDNAQNNGNHVHTIVRDLQNDFGEDLLKQHYENHH